MPNYQNTKIYKLWTHSNDEIYIGSTTQSLSQRLSKHRSDAKKTTKNHMCSSSILFENEGKVMIELMEEFSCENRMVACKREGELIRANSCINKNMPGQTQKEWCELNKEHIKQQCKEPKKLYYIANKEKKKQYQREYYWKTKKIIIGESLETFDI